MLREVFCDFCGGSLRRKPSQILQHVFCSPQHHAAWRHLQASELFWTSVNKTESCWLWTKSRDKDGYGKASKKHRSLRAHQYAWILTYGPIPDGQHILHRCDNPPCVRPDHLFVGTQADNVQDAMRKGRRRILRGKECSWSKLSDEEIERIRSLRGHMTQRRIAQEFGITQGHVSGIQRNKKRRERTAS